MFGKTGGLCPVAELFQTGQMVTIERHFTTDAEADTMD